MDKLNMSTNLKNKINFDTISFLFPNCISEGKLDFDLLKQELFDCLIDEKKEKYQLTWPGKKEAIINANKVQTKTLRPIKEKSKNFDFTKNIYIEGDNLEVLKTLQESYLNKIKLIYIDPPYNTGTNLIYKNNYNISENEELFNSGEIDEDGNKLVVNSKSNGRFHSDWLSMMYSRLKLARNLLKDDGFIVVAIDNNELANLELICNEIFGESNKINTITVVHKPEGRNQEKFFGTSNEFALFYAKNKELANFENVVLDPEIAEKYKLSDKKGNYRLQNFIRMTDGKLAYRSVRPKFWYPIYIDENTNALSTKKFNDNNIEVYPITKAGVEMSWKLLPNSAEELIKSDQLEIVKDSDGFISIMEKLRQTQVIKTHWIRKEYNAIQYGTKIVNELLGGKCFDFPKSIYLIEDIIKLCTKKDDIILDFFSGSSTTAHATMLLNAKENGNRKYIMVQIPEKIEEGTEAKKLNYNTICEVAEERIRRAGNKIKEETNANIDYGFRVYKVDSSNMKDVYYKPSDLTQLNILDLASNIKEDRTSEDILIQVMLDLGLTLDLKIEEKNILNNNVYFVENNALIACFDDNVNIDIIDEICKYNPLKVVFKDVAFKSDKDKINLEERIKKLSPETEISIL